MLQIVLLLTALVVDIVALIAIAARISEFGFSPNKVAALERWQTAYLPVYAIWAAFVVAAFPPLFG